MRENLEQCFAIASSGTIRCSGAKENKFEKIGSNIRNGSNTKDGASANTSRQRGDRPQQKNKGYPLLLSRLRARLGLHQRKTEWDSNFSWVSLTISLETPKLAPALAAERIIFLWAGENLSSWGLLISHLMLAEPRKVLGLRVAGNIFRIFARSRAYSKFASLIWHEFLWGQRICSDQLRPICELANSWNIFVELTGNSRAHRRVSPWSELPAAPFRKELTHR